MPLQMVQTKAACLGPYSPAVKANGFVFASGQLGLDATGNLPASIQDQTRNSLNNLKGVLVAAGSGMDKVCKTTVFLKNISDFAAMNDVYAELFGDHKPARICVEVARMPKDALVEIDAFAVE